jgi:hypothetical protein
LEPGPVTHCDSFKWFSSDPCRIRITSVDASTGATFWAGDRKWGTRCREHFSQSQLSLKNFFCRRHARQEVLRKYSGTGKEILLEKYRK